MSSEKTMIMGELVAVGTPDGSEQPRALVHCTVEEIKGIKTIFVGHRVAIVPLVNLNGSSVPPIVLECERLKQDVAKLKSAIALGQENCDAVYEDLRAERDQARAELAAAGEDTKLLDWLLKYITQKGSCGLKEISWSAYDAEGNSLMDRDTVCEEEVEDIKFDRDAIAAAANKGKP